MAVLQASSNPILLSFDGGSNYKELICLKDYHVPVETATTETSTFCGIYVGLGSITFNPSGNAVCETAPSGTQCTYEDLLAAQTAKTALKFKVQNPTTGSVGIYFYLQGDCYVTSTDLTFATDGLVEFSWTLKGTGTLDVSA